MAASLDVNHVREQFPGLQQKQVFFDNAGGSQTLGSVIKSISDYLSHTNVQLGASYNVGRESTKLYTEGCKAGARYINADPAEVVIGPSTTQLFRNLSFAIKFQPGDELVVSKFDHEANIAPWVAISERLGLTLKWWGVPPTSNPILDPESLKPLLSEKTKLVTCTHASNLLGTINDIKSIAKTVHSVPGAMLCVDGVAYAPHRQIDVKDLEVDFYSFSWYKVYGPHISMLYGRREVFDQLAPLGHYFNPSGTLEQKLGLAAANYELTQSLPIIVDYLGGADPKSKFENIAAHEGKLQKILLDYLNSRSDVVIYGRPEPDSSKRVPTISFEVKGKRSNDVVAELEKSTDFGFRAGHMYSKRLCDDILKAGEDGPLRVSMVHYNTEDEIKAFVAALDKVLSQST